MAYLPIYDEDENNPNSTGQTGVPVANTGATGASSAKGAGSSAPVASAPSGGGTTEPQGSFVDFGSYLNANQGAASNTANQLQGQVANQASGAQGEITGLQGQFNRDATMGSPFGDPYRELSTPTAQSNATAAGGGHKQSSVANGQPDNASGALQLDNPMSGPNAQNPDWAAYLGTQGYHGPTDLTQESNYGQVAKAAQDATQSLGALGSTSGRQAMLQSAYGGSAGYGSGASGFDAGLTGGAGGQGFQALREQYGDLTTALQNANQQAGQRAQQLQGFDAQQAANAAAMVPTLQKYWGGDLNADQNGVPYQPPAVPPQGGWPKDEFPNGVPAGTPQTTVNGYEAYLQNSHGRATLNFDQWMASGQPWSQ